MELRHLRYFIAVADDLNFTKAAQRLRVAQPALSRQIRQLEEEIGVRLLERNQRNVTLTSAGSAFLREAKRIVEHSQQAVHLAQTADAAGAGVLNIGYVWGLFHSLAPPLLARFRAKYPRVAIHLFDLSAVEQAQLLSEGKLDAGFIGFAQEADAARLTKHEVGTCEFFAALPTDHQLARKIRINLAALAQEVFIAVSDESYPGAAQIIASACQEAGFQPKVLQAVARGFTILGLIAANCGVALLPETLRHVPHPGVVFRPLTKRAARSLYLVWNPRRSSPLLAKLVEEMLKLEASD